MDTRLIMHMRGSQVDLNYFSSSFKMSSKDRDMLPPEAQDFPDICYDEAVTMLFDRKNHLLCGMEIDAQSIIDDFRIDSNRVMAYVVRMNIGSWTPSYSLHEWVTAVQMAEIDLMMDVESKGGKALFFLGRRTLETGFLNDHVFKEEAKFNFSFSAWEIKHLFLMFPGTIIIAWMGDREWSRTPW